jgi:hypothetical protein
MNEWMVKDNKNCNEIHYESKDFWEEKNEMMFVGKVYIPTRN